MTRTKYLLVFLLSSAFLSGNMLPAQEAHSHDKSEIHGGESTMTKAHHFETVWMHDHVMVYLYDIDQKPLAAKGVTGEVVFKFKDGKEQKATLELMEAGKTMEAHHAEGEKDAEHPGEGEKHAEHPSEEAKHEAAHGNMSKAEIEAMHKLMSNQDHLVAEVHLENVKEGEVKATFTLKGLPGKGESTATFTSEYAKMSLKPEEKKHEQHH